MKLIVTAGGQGTKLWPYSRESKPKQFQPIIGSESLFSYTINLLLQRHTPDDIYISTKRRYMGIALEQAPQISHRNFIVEPDIAKNRGPAEGLAFLTLSIEHPDEPFMIVQPDCMRLPEDAYLDMIDDVEKLVKRDRKFISGGMKATYPALGVDYLKVGNKVDLDSDLEILEVDEFVGRTSDYHQTKKLIESFYITIHSNHNTWYPDLMLEAYKRFRPDWYEKLMEIKNAMTQSNSEEKIEKIYSEMESGATEEVTKHVFEEGYIVLHPFRWVDIGTWNSVYEYHSGNGDVHVDGNVLAIETRNTLIKNGNPNKLIATYGISDLVIVDTDDILLIVPADQTGKIGDIQKLLVEKNQKHYL